MEFGEKFTSGSQKFDIGENFYILAASISWTNVKLLHSEKKHCLRQIHETNAYNIDASKTAWYFEWKFWAGITMHFTVVS